MALKELILKISTLGGCGGHDKNSLLTVLTLGGCGGLERTLISHNFYVGRVWWS